MCLFCFHWVASFPSPPPILCGNLPFLCMVLLSGHLIPGPGQTSVFDVLPHRDNSLEFFFLLRLSYTVFGLTCPACLEGKKYAYALKGFTTNTEENDIFLLDNTAMLSTLDFQAQNNNQNSNKLPCKYVNLDIIGPISLNFTSLHLCWTLLSKWVVEKSSPHS